MTIASWYLLRHPTGDGMIVLLISSRMGSSYPCGRSQENESSSTASILRRLVTDLLW